MNVNLTFTPEERILILYRKDIRESICIKVLDAHMGLTQSINAYFNKSYQNRTEWTEKRSDPYGVSEII